jgi:hypothetical protein
MTYRDLYFWLGIEAESAIIYECREVHFLNDPPCPEQDELG